MGVNEPPAAYGEGPRQESIARDHPAQTREIRKRGICRQRQNEHEVQLETKGDLINEESLWLSPNGRYLIIKTSVKEIPSSWNSYEDAVLQMQTRGQRLKGAFSFIYQFELIDTYSGHSEFLIDAPLAQGDSDVIWASDSSAVVISGTYLSLDIGGCQTIPKRLRHPSYGQLPP